MQRQFVEQMRLLGSPDKNILVAVSGGIDSVVLLDLFIKSGYTVGVAHANFHLRGDESDQDEGFVKQLGLSFNLRVHIKGWDTNNYASEKGLSIQMAARELRYAWFLELLEQEQYGFLATAHHRNDNLETTLLNFVHGSGLSGLQGIPQKNGNVIRPLLIFTRNEIETYAHNHNLTWREDSSNAGDDYQRNFIRHQVVPKLKEINPSLEETFAKTIDRLNAAAELTGMGLDVVRKKYVVQNDRGQLRILKPLITRLNYPAPVLWEILKEYGFNLIQCELMVNASSGQPGKVFLVPGFRLVIDRDVLILSPDKELWKEVIIKEEQPEANIGPLYMTLRESISLTYSLNDPMIAVFDSEKLTFPLRWRQWKAGDTFQPLGMERQKKISDFLIDGKVSANDKSGVTVLLSGDDIVWVVGYRMSDRFKVTSKTKSTISLHVERRPE